MTQSRPFRIGTRGSALALWQANTVRDRILDASGGAPDSVEIIVSTTSGDRILDRRLADFGGKGLFTKELEVGLEDGEIDCAVHSLKDVPTFLPDGLELAAYLEREDPRDAWISSEAATPMDLKPGAVVGSASLRREALIRSLRPDVEVTLLRGNVETRLGKVESGALDATILAHAGLKRLGLTDRIASVLDPTVFVPAVGQGIVAIEIRSGDTRAMDMVRPLNVAESETAARCERGFLAGLDGSCRSPIAGHATIEGGSIQLVGRLMTPDGVECEAGEATGDGSAPDALGAALAQSILDRATPALLAVLEE